MGQVLSGDHGIGGVMDGLISWEYVDGWMKGRTDSFSMIEAGEQGLGDGRSGQCLGVLQSGHGNFKFLWFGVHRAKAPPSYIGLVGWGGWQHARRLLACRLAGWVGTWENLSYLFFGVEGV